MYRRTFLNYRWYVVYPAIGNKRGVYSIVLYTSIGISIILPNVLQNLSRYIKYEHNSREELSCGTFCQTTKEDMK